jgi:hypothetical protein
MECGLVENRNQLIIPYSLFFVTFETSEYLKYKFNENKIKIKPTFSKQLQQ